MDRSVSNTNDWLWNCNWRFLMINCDVYETGCKTEIKDYAILL